MRLRRTIETEAVVLSEKQAREHVEPDFAHLQLEVLLDIRDILMAQWDLLIAQDTRPAVTHPVSPPPPEVKP